MKTAAIWLAGAVLAGATWANQQDVTGCYDLMLGPWEPLDDGRPVRYFAPVPHESPDSLFYAVPPRVELHGDTARFSGGGAYVLKVPAGGLPTLHDHTGWYVSGDTIRLDWSSGGMTGVTGFLVRRGGELEGAVETFTDVGGVRRYTAALGAEPVSCSAPLLGGPYVVDSLVRSVVLHDGGVLTLGEPLSVDSARLGSRRRGGRYVASGRPADLFEGMDSVLVRLVPGSDTVAAIQLRMAGDKDLLVIVDRLIAEIGPPNEVSAPVVGPSWWRRITRILVSEQRGSRGHRILISDPRLDYY